MRNEVGVAYLKVLKTNQNQKTAVCGQLFNRTPSQHKTSTKPFSSEVHVEQVYLFDKRY
jgi:hypothetical protein